MLKYILTIPLFFLVLLSCGKRTENKFKDGFSIDPKIKKEVEKNVSASDHNYDGDHQDILIYETRMLGDFYEDDKLVHSSKKQDNEKLVFQSFYYWLHDTLVVDGVFGMFGGIGFSITIIKGNATLYHLVVSDEHPSCAKSPKDSLVSRLDVPTTESSITLSEIPDSTNRQILYGYVEFKSEEYYTSNGFADGKEILPRKKQRANMKIYFRSSFLAL